MRTQWKIVFVLIAGLNMRTALARGSAKADASTGEATARALGESYSILSLEKLLAPSPADRPQLLGAIQKLKSYAHTLEPKPMGATVDPVLQYLGVDPWRTLDLIAQNFKRGAPKQNAHATRHIMQVCAECHETAAKPTFTALQPNPGLTLIEQAEFYKFTGRPNDALLYYEKILTTPGAANARPDIWERAVMATVALGIESTGTYFTFVDVLSNLLQETVIGKQQKALATTWRTAGKNWSSERPLPIRINGQLDHARTLMTEGTSNNSVRPGSGLVQLSRAMLELRKVQFTGSLAQKARAFRMAGETRENIPVSGVWLPAEDYYEACIRSSPHGIDASRCWTLLSTLAQRDARFNLESDTNQQLQTLLR